MGNRMEFYVGDAKVLAAAFETTADLRMPGAGNGHVDFSLHLDPEAMDELLAAACEAASISRLSWWDDAMAEQLGGDENGGVAVVKPNIVRVLGSLELLTFLPKARPWLGSTLTRDFEQALGELIELCRGAAHSELDVIFTWSA
jgi:hypothetical protein